MTGFLVDDVDGAVAAVPRALTLDRAPVAEVARRRFSADRMVDEYLAVYRAPVALSHRASSLQQILHWLGRSRVVMWLTAHQAPETNTVASSRSVGLNP